MTICIAVKVHDCLVFVADSASSMVTTDAAGNQIVMRVYDNGHKLFNLIRGRPVAAMTCGLGNFGNSSISTIAKEIRHEIASGAAGIDLQVYTIKQVADYAFGRFSALFAALPDPVRNASSFTFFVGGYSAGAAGSELWKMQLTGATVIAPQLIAGEQDCRIEWDGQPDACVRLVLGISPQTTAILTQAGISAQDAAALTQQIAQASQAQLLEPSMPVQDAIDLARFLAETTVSFVRFLPGANTVGGDLDVATVTKFEGFRWISRKHYYPMGLNVETNHGA
ncbi:hypothetical protein EOA27_05100 [Mesorhizobium sp. M2A.F.Ca.ET.037.01.1.1]|uniref:hypothetical protein n=1 Tax=unclassified Mesorhizobium TaxID=325217 RepID=UPI000FCA257B|nr:MULTISPECIES: hypothetical protein [unclassified Mesorhizobium]RUY10305.1 hypothetical protein EOA25_08955 [Mesorhizobium sp. M2A.F.Ca.ET.040.01.1.1]RUX21788.1 hypothetical protein EOA27_05100 [Mesorhizobium sp. M2A.F.Ca.ET.037.01.1.1]RWA93611.1 MAG: hypothetical protein EOQ31_00490 [Mesorhizobium sp.]RWX65505.1 hypothetical protein EOA24_20575 [Mesorhizobium sp. M2A.F.Ca.ET.039.01.1.1]TIV18828.1 MAG: hypothetical protein E5V95_11570 [Mesorhizobium sp.]